MDKTAKEKDDGAPIPSDVHKIERAGLLKKLESLQRVCRHPLVKFTKGTVAKKNWVMILTLISSQAQN